MEIRPTQTLSPGACPRKQMEVTGSFFQYVFLTCSVNLRLPSSLACFQPLLTISSHNLWLGCQTGPILPSLPRGVCI